MAKARHPHDSSRPSPKAVSRALAKGDMDALRLALSVRQRRFAEEYVVDFNGAAAAIRAGYAIQYADRQAHVLNNHEGVAAYIDHLSRSKEAKIASMTPDYLIQRLAEVMNRPGVRAADELRAIEMAMKHLGMFIERTEITGKDGDPLFRQVEEEAGDFTNNLNLLIERARKDAEAKKVDIDLV